MRMMRYLQSFYFSTVVHYIFNHSYCQMTTIYVVSCLVFCHMIKVCWRLFNHCELENITYIGLVRHLTISFRLIGLIFFGSFLFSLTNKHHFKFTQNLCFNIPEFSYKTKTLTACALSISSKLKKLRSQHEPHWHAVMPRRSLNSWSQQAHFLLKWCHWSHKAEQQSTDALLRELVK